MLRFFTETDPRLARRWWLSTLVFGAIGVALTVGIFFIDVKQGVLADVLAGVRTAWWAPAAVTGVFVLLAFVGAPQIALIAATAAVFGPVEGVILSWVATMISASVGFYLGRAAGAKALARLEGNVAARLLAAVKNNGFLASALIRLVPSGPFILVNMALGATGMRASWFFGGAGLGSIPKILLVSFAGHGFSQLFEGQNANAIWFLLGAAAIWAAIVFVVRPLVMKKSGETDPAG